RPQSSARDRRIQMTNLARRQGGSMLPGGLRWNGAHINQQGARLTRLQHPLLADDFIYHRAILQHTDHHICIPHRLSGRLSQPGTPLEDLKLGTGPVPQAHGKARLQQIFRHRTTHQANPQKSDMQGSVCHAIHTFIKSVDPRLAGLQTKKNRPQAVSLGSELRSLVRLPSSWLEPSSSRSFPAGEYAPPRHCTGPPVHARLPCYQSANAAPEYPCYAHPRHPMPDANG